MIGAQRVRSRKGVTISETISTRSAVSPRKWCVRATGSKPSAVGLKVKTCTHSQISHSPGTRSAIKVSGNFSKAYIRAFYSKGQGFQDFNNRKQADAPELGQNYYVSSYRHLWEVDLWKYLKELNRYTDVLN